MSIIKDSLKVILLSSIVSFSVIFVFAQTGFWDEPNLPPPGDNRPAPLTLDAQGGLTIPGALTLQGVLNFKGLTMDVVFYNGDEDSITGWSYRTECDGNNNLCINYDTCNGDGWNAFSCGVMDNKTCVDQAARNRSFTSPEYDLLLTEIVTRDITCVKRGALITQ